VGEAVRELAGWLKTLPGPELDQLLSARPDARPYQDFEISQLARWLTHPTSVAGAVQRLDLFGLQLLEVCHALAEQGRLTRTALAAAVGDAATAAQVDSGIAGLQRLALVWPKGNALHLPDLSYVLAPRPLALGAPLRTGLLRVEAADVRAMATRLGLGSAPTKKEATDKLERHLGDPAALRATLATAPKDARLLLEKVDGGTGLVHNVNGGYYGGRRPSRPPEVEWLAQRALLLPADWMSTLEVPREVARSLRGGRLVRRLDPERPAVTATTPPPRSQVDQVAAGAATRLVDVAGALTDLIDIAPLTRLKDGGVGVRELRRLGAALGYDEAGVTGLLTLLGAAGLLDPNERIELDARYDGWAAAPAAERYSELVRAWLGLRQPLSVTKPDGKLVPALLAVSLSPPIRLPVLRRSLLTDHDGVAPSVQDLVRRVAWDDPSTLRSAADVVVPEVVAEAERLGLLACGTLSDAGRGLLAGRPVADLGIGRWFPAPVEDLHLQADLTAIVPGPPSSSVRALLDGSADRESQGGAATWRFSPTSVRRALDGGTTAAELLDRLGALTRHGVPQALDYLIRDVERRHGRVRIGAAGCYLRCTDPALAQEVLSTRSLRRLGLREVAPAVLVAGADPDTALAALQAAGYAPVCEDASGQAVLQRIGGQRGTRGADLARRLTLSA
jgi:hypothetical protein